jgi:hypothetical protein
MRGSFQGSGGNRGRLGALCSALTFAALAIPAAASGDPIYVAPDDQSSGFFCSESQPCALVVGINLVADDGDEVLLAPDIYETSDELEVPATAQNVTIRPRDPGTRAWINSTAQTALQLSGGNATVRRISVTQNNPGGTGIFALASGSRVENVVSISNGDTPCQFATGTIRDSICLAGAASGRALRVSLGAGTASTTIRNATLAAPNTGGTVIYASASGATASVSIDVASSIVFGADTDVETETASGGSVDVALAASNFESAIVDPDATVTAPGSAGNQTEEPIFTGFGLEQDPASPTVNAGIVDGKTGTTDVYGDARPQGAANDIGADELPLADELPDTVAPETTITKKPKKRTRSRRARFAFASSEPGSFECRLDGSTYEPCSSPRKLKRLKRRLHAFSVRAIDTAGNTDATPAKYGWRVRKRG